MKNEHIKKIGSNKWRLVSKKTGKNLGTFDSLAGAKKHEREVEFFKHQKENKKIQVTKTQLEELIKNSIKESLDAGMVQQPSAPVTQIPQTQQQPLGTPQQPDDKMQQLNKKLEQAGLKVAEAAKQEKWDDLNKWLAITNKIVAMKQTLSQQQQSK